MSVSVGLAVAVGAASAVFPPAGMLAVLAVAVVGPIIVMVARDAGSLTRAIGARLYLYVPVALLFTSLIQIVRRSATSSSFGFAAVYEFALEGFAVALVLLGLRAERLTFRWTVPAILWGALGVFAMTSAIWSPSPLLSMLKGGQLLTLGVVVPLLSANFPDRDAIARFLGRYAAALFAAIMLFQAATQGVGSMWRTYEIGNPMYVDGRVRLSLLEIYPLTLGLVTGALILLVLVSKPQPVDWLVIGFLSAINVLTFSRGPLVILVALLPVFVILRLLSRLGRASAWTVVVVLGIVGLLLVAALFVLNGTGAPLGLVQRYLPTDATSLNGRLPLWNDTVGRILAMAYTPAGLFLGHGFASFRFYGLGLFSYAGETHNAPLQVLYELGLGGLFLWLAAVGSCLVQVWNDRIALSQNLIRLLPLIYLLAEEMLDSSLADSRSFVLLILLLYSFRFRDGLTRERSAHTAPALLLRRRLGDT